jgi:uncharacterized protein DUF5631/uncharacterized protein DUF5632
VAVFGRNTARQRLRRAARESLKIPTFDSPVDCTPWVTGGLWPAELSTVTADTAPLVKYLKTDLQRIVNSANEELKGIRRAGLASSTRQAEEARVINDARAFAVRRVESTVRHLRNMTTKSATQYRPVNGEEEIEKTQRFKIAPPRPAEKPAAEELSETSETPTPSEASKPFEMTTPFDTTPIEAPATSLPTPEFSPAEELDNWESAADTVEHEAVVAEPESLVTAGFQAPSPFDSDDTEVLEELASLLHETSPPVEPPPRHEAPEAPQPPAPAGPPVSMFEPVSEPPVVAEPAGDDTETTRDPMPQLPSESEYERLQRLLQFVARQEPGLRWAVGNRDDGTTVLLTDLAHGWIPPGITLPADVQLLEPARRGGTAKALLGKTTLAVTYAPGDPLGWATDYDVTETSTQPRDLPAVDDLGWVLSEATHWRDGLPRLVNTLAKAGAAGTGIVDAEIDILRVYMDTSRYQLLAQYPDVDHGLLLNCLLLAATEGIANKDQVNANYHFAWFQMLSSPPASGWKAGA